VRNPKIPPYSSTIQWLSFTSNEKLGARHPTLQNKQSGRSDSKAGLKQHGLGRILAQQAAEFAKVGHGEGVRGFLLRSLWLCCD